MSTIRITLDPSPDGTLHLPLPPELRGTKVKVEAHLERADANVNRAKPGLWKELPAGFWMAADFDAPLEDFKEYME